MVNEITFEGLTGTLAGLEMGSSEGSPLVCIHGWLDNAASFMPLARLLPLYRWTCIDLPGHGKSAYRPPGAIYHYVDYLGDLYRVLESLEFSRYTLVGHSLGAGIAAIYAAAFPDMVECLVLIDGVGPISHDSEDSLTQLRKSLQFLGRSGDTGPRHYPSWDQLVERRLAAGSISREAVEILLSRGTVREGEGATVLSDDRLKQRSPLYMSQRKVVSWLKGIDARTLLVMAEDGLLNKRASTRERVAAIRDLTRKMVPGAHHVHLDNPEVVAPVIDEFLREGVTPA